MSDPFARMHERLFRHNGIGAEGTLAGEPVMASIERGVAVTGEYGEVTAYRDVAVIYGGNTPKGGDQLVVAGETHVVDSILENNGYSVRCVLR